MLKKTYKTTIIALLALVTLTSLQAVKADALIKTLSGVVQVPLGGVFGTVRGGTAKAAQYADAFSYEAGDSPVAKIIGVPVGIIVGAAAGGVTGLLNGVITGVRESADEAFTTEGFSLDGDFLDYDPYDFN